MKIPQSYLRRHESYILRRIESINSVLSSYSWADTAINRIINCFTNRINDFSFFPGDPNPLKELYHLYSDWDTLRDGDLIGFLYQTLSSSDKKKKSGQFFTPAQIVDRLLESLIMNNADYDTITLLDPACGSGQFLITAYRLLLDEYIKNGHDADAASMQIITTQLFGSDIDETAVAIARYNLKTISGHTSENLFKLDYIADSIEYGLSPLTKRSFSIITGNPPWGSVLSKKEKDYFKSSYTSAQSGINTFTLFIERSMSLLSGNGTIAFMIPEAYLNIKAHICSRNLVLNNFKIRDIRLWGEQFKNIYAPAITISMMKESSTESREKNIVQIFNPKEQSTAILIPQSHYLTTYQNIFKISFSQRAEVLINKIEEKGSLFLKNNALFFLGIVTGSNIQHISEIQSDKHPDPILVGKDIDRYKITFSGHHFNCSTEKLQQVAPLHFYQTKGKVVYKFIGKRLTFAVDHQGFYTLNNVNGFIPNIENCTPEYIAALLNSPVMQYYYEKNFFTVKVLRNNLEKLPLKILPTSEIQRITSLYTTASSSSSAEERETAIDTINDIFFSTYGISDKNALRMLYGATEEDQGQGFIFN